MRAYLTLNVTNREGVTEANLNRPERKNAMTLQMVQDLRSAFAEWALDDAVRVVVLGGEGGSFSSGLDLAERNTMSALDWSQTFGLSRRELHREIFAFEKPVVLALEGYAINAASALALSADFIVAGETAYLQVGEVQQGRPAAMNLAWLRLRFGDAVARRVALRGDKIRGPELLRLGLALECVPDPDVRRSALELGRELAQLPLEGTRNTKKALRALAVPPVDGDWFLHAESITSGMTTDQGSMGRVR
jgi:enoyl-CoA hydratase/carnithine racemase